VKQKLEEPDSLANQEASRGKMSRALDFVFKPLKPLMMDPLSCNKNYGLVFMGF
jgi:hypothetical protein